MNNKAKNSAGQGKRVRPCGTCAFFKQADLFRTYTKGVIGDATWQRVEIELKGGAK